MAQTMTQPALAPTVLGILQARTSSSRLPGKVLLPLLDQPMILRQIERLRRATSLDHLVLATSTDATDDPLAATVEAAGVSVARGSLDDVLERFIQAAAPYRPIWVVRLTGDCPLADPVLIDRTIRETLAADADYGSTALEPTWPDGLDVEVIRYSVLNAVASQPRSKAEREHVTLAIHQQPERYRLHSVKGMTDLSSLRWTVDDPRDFAFVQEVYTALYPSNPQFGTADILELLRQRPALAALNGDIQRNEGLMKSLAAERPIA
jgi:spore coat polysaccharide biosynthesis protein SpsF